MQLKKFTTVSLLVGAVKAVPCTSDQLQGYYSSFSLPGGGGDYYAGTRQVVSWNWATGSDITRISSVTLMNTTDILNPTTTRGVPVTISPTDYDQSGAIVVTLPDDLSVGKYVYGVQVMSGSDECTVYSDVFNIISEDDSEGDNDRCNFGDTRCARQSTGYRTCIQGEKGRRYGAFQTCTAGQTCEQSGTNAYCSLGSGNNGGNDNGGVVHRCEEGETRCARQNSGYRTCITTDAGRRFRAFRVCPSGQTCAQTENGAVCSLGSTNGGNQGTCYTYAQYSCDGNGYRVCEYDTYQNLTWSATTSCGYGKTCYKSGDSVVCIPV